MHLPRLCLLLSVALLLSGCSQLPRENHQQLTRLEQMLGDQQQAAQARCERLDDQLNDQGEQLSQLDEQLTELQRQLGELAKARIEPPPPAAPPRCPAPVRSYRLGDKQVVGETEWIWLAPPETYLEARIDSGAATSSLSAVDLVRFEREGKKWARFKVFHQDSNLEEQVEAPIVRYVIIRQASADSTERRPVVELNVRLGEIKSRAEFTLTDRSLMEFPVLLGREFLRDMAVVDVGKAYIHPKSAPATEASR